MLFGSFLGTHQSRMGFRFVVLVHIERFQEWCLAQSLFARPNEAAPALLFNASYITL